MQEQAKTTLIEPSDPRWMDFITSHPDANIFHHPAWLELMTDCYVFKPHILTILDERGEVRAGLPFMEVKCPFMRKKWVSMPFSDYCKPLYRGELDHDALIHQMIQIFKDEHLKMIEVRWRLPEHPAIQQTSEFILHTIRLNPDPSLVSKKFKRTHLQNIHTAQERGVTVEFGDQFWHLQAFYDLQLETRKRHGVPAQPKKYFELLYRHIIKAGMGFVLLAHHEKEIIAGMVYLGWGKTLIAKYAASREDHFNLRPNNLLFWEGMRWGCQNGFTVFDMGRTEVENTGLRTFKSRWGAQEEPLFYSTISSARQMQSSGRLKRLMQVVIQKSPLWVCRLSGELLYRHVA